MVHRSSGWGTSKAEELQITTESAFQPAPESSKESGGTTNSDRICFPAYAQGIKESGSIANSDRICFPACARKQQRERKHHTSRQKLLSSLRPKAPKKAEALQIAAESAFCLRLKETKKAEALQIPSESHGNPEPETPQAYQGAQGSKITQ